MAETFSNGGTANVGVGGVTDSATSLPVLYRSGLPASGTFRAKIGSEIIKVTTGGQSDATWTVVRGEESTTAVAHAEGEAIRQVFTAQAIVDALADAGGGGSDVPVTFTPPVDADFSWGNQGSASITSNGDSLFLGAAAGTGSPQMRSRRKTITGGGCTVSLGCQMIGPMTASNTADAGLELWSSSTGMFLLFGFRWASGVLSLIVDHYRSTGTQGEQGGGAYSTSVFSCPIGAWSIIFLRVILSGADLATYQWSPDGHFWSTVFTETTTTHMTAAECTRAGFFYNYHTGTANLAGNGLKVFSFVNV